MDELDLRIRTHVYSSFVREGRPPTPAETAAALGLGEQEAAAAYRRLDEARALVLRSGTTEILMLNPFSAAETPHRVEAGGRAWYANCAWDALGIPHALGLGEARIASSCPDCGEPLRLELRDGEVALGAELLVHFVVPARRWWESIGFT